VNIFKTVLPHALKYLTGSAVASGITLLMMKYYTAVFLPAQFGIIALYLVMFQYVMTFSSLSLDSGSTRLYFDYRKTKRDEYLSTIFWLITFLSVIVLVVGLLFADSISNWIAKDSQSVYMVTLVMGIGGAYVSFLMRILYNEHKSKSVLKHTIFQTLVNHISSVLFISIFNLGIFGRISGQGLGYFANIFTLLREFSKENLFKLKLTFDKAMAKETFFLTFPTMIAAIQAVVFVYLDRIFLKHYIGDSAVGIYTLGYILGQGLSMVYEAMSQAMLPKVYSDMNENYEKSRNELEFFSYRYYLGLILITFVISLLSPVIISAISNENYSEAASVMPFIMVGFMMGGFYKIPSLVLGFHKKVWVYPFLAFFAFGINAFLNWKLIPIYGISGAAFASFIGLFLYSIVLQLMCFKYMSRKYNISIGIGYAGILFTMLIIFIVYQ
jgi:O-antigen/teichoic acid export membrane protein